MAQDKLITGSSYRIETISHLLVGHYTGVVSGVHRFELVNELDEPIDAHLDFTDEQLNHSFISPMSSTQQ